MPTTIQYALMAATSYISTRPDINKFPVPDGWGITKKANDPLSGFEAATFTSGTELVISFAGTYPGTLLGRTNSLGLPIDFVADLDLGVGLGSDQLLQAVEYYLDRKRENPGATITLTGHSLGGGLAALVGVFFGIPAVTFDQAPFANAAQAHSILNPLDMTSDVALVLKTSLLSAGYTVAELAPLTSFLSARDANGGIPNANLVTTTRVDGEFLSDWIPVSMFDIIGNPATIINHAPTSATGIDLHAQSLLIDFLQSDATATTSATGQRQSLSQVTYKLTDLLGMLCDARLYSNSTDTPAENFLERLVRHEFGNAPGVTTADAMLTRFTADLWKLAQDGGLTMNEGIWSAYSNWNNVSKALTAFAMQFYYEDTTNAKDRNKQLFTDLTTAGTGSNGIQFDLRDVSTEVAAAMDTNDKVDLSKAKGYQYFLTYLDTTSAFTQQERTLIKSMLPALRDWYVQAGNGGMIATDTLNRGAFMLGGNSGDALTGGTMADLLVGNGGDDLLRGGQGNDMLMGGSGNDAYVYTTGDGLDTILDSDGHGSIAMDGSLIAGGAQFGDTHVHRDAAGHLYVDVGTGLIIDGNIYVQNWQAGQLGLAMNGPAADPAGLTTLSGNDSDNYIVLGNVYNRDPNDSRTSEAILADGSGTLARNNSHVGANTAILEGGLGADIIIGSQTQGTRIYADSRVDTATAIANGNSEPNSGLRGDWLAGGNADDILVGSDGKDVLAGGGGTDLLIGGAGDDLIYGDDSAVAQSFDWGLTNIDGKEVIYPSILVPAASANGAADVIYAGNGNDRVWGGLGNDIIFGEGGDDQLSGDEGNDIILGGANNDLLWGAAGNDYLDGGEGVDELMGGAGDDVLVGGKGNDTLWGEAGQDTYAVDNSGDIVTENLNEGYDRVNSTVSYTLSANIEDLVLGGGAVNDAGSATESKGRRNPATRKEKLSGFSPNGRYSLTRYSVDRVPHPPGNCARYPIPAPILLANSPTACATAQAAGRTIVLDRNHAWIREGRIKTGRIHAIKMTLIEPRSMSDNMAVNLNRKAANEQSMRKAA